jgi:hypothetical protein
MENLPTSLAVAIIAVGLIQFLKNAPWFPGVTKENPKINAIFGVLVAAACATGIEYHYDPVAGAFWVTGLKVAAIKSGLLGFAKQWALQQFLWKGFKVTKLLEGLKGGGS